MRPPCAPLQWRQSPPLAVRRASIGTMRRTEIRPSRFVEMKQRAVFSNGCSVASLSAVCDWLWSGRRRTAAAAATAPAAVAAACARTSPLRPSAWWMRRLAPLATVEYSGNYLSPGWAIVLQPEMANLKSVSWWRTVDQYSRCTVLENKTSLVLISFLRRL